VTPSLRTLLSPARIQESLPAPLAWHPHPTVAERGPWEALPASIREAAIVAADQVRGNAWPVLPATLYADYRRTGNRVRYETPYFERRGRIGLLVVAECVRGDGRHLDDLLDGLWAVCEETSWCIPAHSRTRRFAGSALPDPSEPVVDLFAADTASTLAWAAYLLRPELEREAPVLLSRITDQVRSRLLDVYASDDSWPWLWGDPERGPNNWNPWIHANLLASALLLEEDRHRLASMVIRVVRGLDAFLEGYGPDGGCDEGPSYWWRAAGSLFDCLDTLHSATGGRLDGFTLPTVREMAAFLPRMHVGGEWYVNFADGAARQARDGELLYAFARRVGDADTQRHALTMRDAAASDEDERRDLGRRLRRLFDRDYAQAARPAPPLPRDSWLPSLQVLTTRQRSGTTEGLFVAAKGGDNAESHNHNDVGNFIVALDGVPALIDAGVGVYSRQTFSPAERYGIWTMRSAFHNLPLIDGVEQRAGREFRATDVQCEIGEAASWLRLDLAQAYPAEAGVRRWVRTVRLERVGDGRVVIEDEWELEREPGELALHLLSWPRPRLDDARMRLSTPTRPLLVVWEPGLFTAAAEPVATGDDARLRSTWGEEVHRTRLTVRRPPQRGSWCVEVRPG
jgi:hypothetical protein